MGRAPCCSGDHSGLKKGPWSQEEDMNLKSFLLNNPTTSWRLVPSKAGLIRCGKSCRLRWMNYLRPDIKRGNFTKEEEGLIVQLHEALGNKWSLIASHLPGRTDNEIKNLWNTKLRKALILKGINPITHQPFENPPFSSLYVESWVKAIEMEMAILARLTTQASLLATTINNSASTSSGSGSTDELRRSLPGIIPSTTLPSIMPQTVAAANLELPVATPSDSSLPAPRVLDSLLQETSQASESSLSSIKDMLGPDSLLHNDLPLDLEFEGNGVIRSLVMSEDMYILQDSESGGLGLWD